MSDGRKNNGGARPGSGRKPKAMDLQLHGILSDVWPIEKRHKSLSRLVEISISHDSQMAISANKLLLAYAYGNPIDRQEISGPDGEPLQAYVTVSPDDWNAPQTE